IRTLVAGVGSVLDGSQVLSPAIALARRSGARLHLVHAFEFADPVADAYDLLRYERGEPEAAFQASLQVALDALAAEASAPPGTVCTVAAGAPAEVLCEVADRERADLVLVGATHHRSLAHLFGGTAERVAREAPAPVLVLRDSPPTSIA